jgi:carbonic anhydrase/acetyltransferase-like protein (isoleucine patch superfamily)
MLKEFEGVLPAVANTAFIDESSVIIGDVVIGENSSVWPITAIRGDVNIIRIGNSTNIQDGSVLHGSHVSEFNPSGAELHGCRIGNLCLIGMGSIVMDNAIVEDQVIIGSGSLVTPGKVLESGYMYLGSPARKARALTDREKESLAYTANYYVALKNRY